jgi:hypothetical protein
MASRLQCPSCSRTVRVPDELVGKPVRCPDCLTTFPAGSQPEAEPGLVARSGPAPSAVPSNPEPGLLLEAGETTAAHTEQLIAPAPAPGPPVAFPDPDEEERPWEESDRPQVRRDCDPHRGPLILVLGIISLVVGALSLPSFLCGLPIAILAPFGLLLGIGAWVMASRDLAKMAAGTMDPDGKGITLGGRICAILGTILDVLATLAVLALAAYLVFAFSTGASGVPVAPPPAVPVAPPPGQKASADGAVPRLPHDLPRLVRAHPAGAPEES